MRQVVLKITLVSLVWAALHSALAARPTKDLAARVLGEQARNGLYRITYVGVWLAAFGALAAWLWRLPDRTLYRVPRPWAYLFRALQGFWLGLGASAMLAMGVTRISGLWHAWEYLLHRRDPGMPEEGNGPAQRDDGEINRGGPFRWWRHPLDLMAPGFLWSTPHMTVKGLTLAVLATLYEAFGIWHEEQRQRAAYGPAFDRYRRETPLLWPW